MLASRKGLLVSYFCTIVIPQRPLVTRGHNTNVMPFHSLAYRHIFSRTQRQQEDMIIKWICMQQVNKKYVNVYISWRVGSTEKQFELSSHSVPLGHK